MKIDKKVKQIHPQIVKQLLVRSELGVHQSETRIVAKDMFRMTYVYIAVAQSYRQETEIEIMDLF